MREISVKEEDIPVLAENAFKVKRLLATNQELLSKQDFEEICRRAVKN